jgi:hypothetical protein
MLHLRKEIVGEHLRTHADGQFTAFVSVSPRSNILEFRDGLSGSRPDKEQPTALFQGLHVLRNQFSLLGTEIVNRVLVDSFAALALSEVSHKLFNAQ